MVVVVWGRHVKNVKPIIRVSEDLVLCEFYDINHLYFIPLLRERNFGLFQDGNKKNYFELDERLEKRLLALPQESKPEKYLKEIQKFNPDMKKVRMEYEANKDEINSQENKEFIRFLKTIGIILGIIFLILVIQNIFF